MKKNKVALVTGGSRGIGAATIKLLVANHYSVCINYLQDKSAALDLLEQIQSKGGNGVAIQADVSDEQQVVQLFESIDEQLGNINALVNNAGILFQQMPIENMTAERINKLFRTNVTSYFLCCREAIKRMSKQRGGEGGAIVNVSSLAAVTGSPFEYVDYAASKGAVDTLTKGLSREVASQGIRVNCVRPGFIHTDMHASGGEPNRVKRLSPSIPMQRGGEPEEVAQAILWLLRDEASYVTGSFTDVAGGR